MQKRDIAFCSVITADYVPYIRTTFESLRVFHPHAAYVALVVGANGYSTGGSEDIQFLSIREFEHGMSRNLQHYKEDTSLRWLLKPQFIRMLLKNYEKVFWVDSDLYFFSPIEEQIDRLGKEAAILLTPEWKSLNPDVYHTDFMRNFESGIFNAGFMGFHSSALDTVQSWIAACQINLTNEPDMGLYYEQGYLNVFHLAEPRTRIIYHRGYNLASWNRIECRRERSRDGRVLIRGRDPVVFIHFASDTIKFILKGPDKLLRPYLRTYIDHFTKLAGPNIGAIKGHKISMIRSICRNPIGGAGAIRPINRPDRHHDHAP